METDILIATSLVVVSVVALLALVVSVARVVREEPQSAPAPQLPPGCGW